MPSARPMSSVTVSFGLVAIPVNVYSGAIATERIAFNFLRASDGSRVKQQYIAVNDGKVVPRSEITKGYEFAKDQFVIFSAKELKELEDKSSKTIDIEEFVPLESVDPIYFDGTYLLAPEKGGSKPYALLTRALRESGLCAVGRWVSHGREHIVALRPYEDGLAMHQLHFQAEIRSMKDLEVEEAKVSEPELKLARQLIDQLAAKSFNPREYANEFNARLAAAVQRKVEGKEVSLSAEATPGRGGENVIDLMQALKRSLGARPAGGAERGRRSPRRATAHPSRRASRR
jgi:DNA end-binding protein Ku